jgi:dihydroflavonol-4-reductase
VLVTGASGFIASHIISQLLAAGYRVRGTVRDPARTAKHSHLMALPGAVERLDLVPADLLDPDAFDEAVVGCDYVLHTASPFQLDVGDPQRDLVEPAVNGTLSVLRACQEAGSARRVVLTSSVAAITDRADGHVYTEADWNTSSSLTRNPYYFSKTLAEQAAWGFVDRSSGFDLVVINPFYVIGPLLGPEPSTSHAFLTGLTKGSAPAILDIEWPFVDVRDVARAHILAMENPDAGGRYIVAAGIRTMRQVVDLLKANGWGNRYRLPSMSVDRGIGVPLSKLIARFQSSGTRDYLTNHLGGVMRFDSSKVQAELGLVFRDLDDTILETMEDLERSGHLGKRRQG